MDREPGANSQSEEELLAPLLLLRSSFGQSPRITLSLHFLWYLSIHLILEIYFRGPFTYQRYLRVKPFLLVKHTRVHLPLSFPLDIMGTELEREEILIMVTSPSSLNWLNWFQKAYWSLCLWYLTPLPIQMMVPSQTLFCSHPVCFLSFLNIAGKNLPLIPFRGLFCLRYGKAEAYHPITPVKRKPRYGKQGGITSLGPKS